MRPGLDKLLPKIIILLLTIAIAYLALRHFALRDRISLRSNIEQFNDFQPLYLGTVIWRGGGNPYSPSDSLRALRENDPKDFQRGSDDPNTLRVLYPPSAFPVIVPVSLLPWETAYWCQFWLLLSTYGLALLFLSQGIGNDWSDLRRYLFFSYGLAMAPLHYGLSGLNVSILAAALICISLRFMDDRRVLAGVALGVSAAIKPQLAVVFILYLLISRRWRPFMATILTGALLSAISLVWMYYHHVHWLGPYIDNIHVLLNPDGNGSNSIRRNGAPNFALLNVQPIIFLFIGNLSFTHLIADIIIALATCCFLAVSFRQRREDQPFEMAGLCALLTLLPVYQRYYNATLLLPLAVWAISNMDKWMGRWIFVGLLTFLVQFGFTAGPASLNVFWTYIVRPCGNWFVLFSFFGLVAYRFAQQFRLRNLFLGECKRNSEDGGDIL